jgi:hypothetical protein
MMIANRITKHSGLSQVISPRLFTIPSPHMVNELAGEDPARYAKKRDREVPYGMKGGEH